MRLDPLEVYVLDSFRLQGRTWLRFDDIIDRCTVVRRHAIDEAITHLEGDSLIVRCFDFVELTDTGRRYLGMR